MFHVISSTYMIKNRLSGVVKLFHVTAVFVFWTVKINETIKETKHPHSLKLASTNSLVV